MAASGGEQVTKKGVRVVSAQTRFVNRHKRAIMSAYMLLVDAVSLLLAAWLAVLIRSLFSPRLTDPAQYYALIPYLLVFLLANLFVRLYPGSGISPDEELRATTYASSAVMILLAVFLFLTQRGLQFSRFVFLAFWFLAVILVPLVRALAKQVGHRLGLWGEPIAIIGFGEKGSKTYRFLKDNHQFGLTPIIIVNEAEAGVLQSPVDAGVSVIDAGLFADSRDLLRSLGIRMAILVPDETSEDLNKLLVDEQSFGLKRLLLISKLNWLGGTAVTAHNVDGLLGLEVESNLLKPLQRGIKRVIDLFLGVIGLVLALPVFTVIALLIKLDSPGPVLYRHERIGRAGKSIRIWKFRTMVHNAEALLDDLISRDDQLQVEWEANHKLKQDPRVTRIGRLLRRSSVDELPQIINILKGEMSFVGPRPIVQDEVKYYEGGFELYKKVRPGLSGLWQVSGRSDTNYAYRVSLDEYYIRHWTIWLDLYILIKTAWVVISRTSAY